MYSNVAGVQQGDRSYCVLPLYHSSGSKNKTDIDQTAY